MKRPSSNRDSCYYHPEKLKALRVATVELKEYSKMASLEETAKGKALEPIKESKTESKLKAVTNNANKPKTSSSCASLALNSNRINLVSKPVTPQSKSTPAAAAKVSSSPPRKPTKQPVPIKLDSSRMASGTTPKRSPMPISGHNLSDGRVDKTEPHSNEPRIYTMFEGFPQPFTRSIDVTAKISASSKSVSTCNPKSSTKKPKTTTTTSSKSKPNEAKLKAKSKKNKPGNG